MKKICSVSMSEYNFDADHILIDVFGELFYYLYFYLQVHGHFVTGLSSLYWIRLDWIEGSCWALVEVCALQSVNLVFHNLALDFVPVQ